MWLSFCFTERLAAVSLTNLSLQKVSRGDLASPQTVIYNKKKEYYNISLKTKLCFLWSDFKRHH